ncbi:MAG: hypothetical protein HKN62_13735 [Phycisphaerales bacterium]|nr:hypothetical protein [Phycisphaerales bacterium]
MLISGRRLLLVACCLLALVGVVLWQWEALVGARLGLILVAAGLVGVLVVGVFVRPPSREPLEESDDITALEPGRRRELLRGTSMYLQKMQYRYSVRADAAATGARRSFGAEVNSIQLGFVPAVITDNTTDRQGYGYVAFVHDGQRWRGPGLPCPDDQAEAVRHAARCVSPLATEEETHFEGTRG